MSASMRGSLHLARLDRAQYRHHSRSTRQRPLGASTFWTNGTTRKPSSISLLVTTYNYNYLNMLGDSMSRGKAADGTSAFTKKKMNVSRRPWRNDYELSIVVPVTCSGKGIPGALRPNASSKSAERVCAKIMLSKRRLCSDSRPERLTLS
jgi:hypothetical protein